MIFWLSRCPQCGSVFREHECAGKGTMSLGTYNVKVDRLESASVTPTQLSLFEERA